MPARIAREHERGPEVRLEHDQDNGGAHQHAGAERPRRGSRAFPRASARYAARTTIIRILASSLNWNVIGPIATQRAAPPTPSPIASVTTRSPRLHEVQRPPERLEPAVVERGRDDEGDDRDAGPHQPAREHRARSAGGRRPRCSSTPSPARPRQQRRVSRRAGGRTRSRRRTDAAGPVGRTGAA